LLSEPAKTFFGSMAFLGSGEVTDDLFLMISTEGPVPGSSLSNELDRIERFRGGENGFLGVVKKPFFGWSELVNS